MPNANSYNFLRWNGTNTPKLFTISAANFIVPFFANVDFITLDPFTLGTCVASNGIDTYSFVITQIIDDTGADMTLSQQCEWNGVDELKIYRNVTVPDGGVSFFVKFLFSDVMGNQILAPVEIEVDLSTVSVAWVAYPVSSVCTLDAFGDNTGYQAWTQLILQNSITHADIVPLTLKPNIISDADYVAPVTNYVTCPATTLPYSPLYIANFSQNNADASPLNVITIFNVYLFSATLGIGSTPIALNMDVNIPPGNTFRLNVPAGVWDSISFSYTIGPGGNMATAVPLRYWKINTAGVVQGFGPSGSGLGDNPVDNSGILAATGGITIPTASSGVTVFAQ